MSDDKFLNPDYDPSEELNMNQDDDGDNDNLVINLEDTSEELPKFEAMPAGTYDAVIENCEWTISQSDNPMLSWTFKVVDPQYPNRLLFYHTVLNKEAGLSRLKRLLIRVFPDGLDLSKFNAKKFAEAGEALGLPCRVKIRVRPYKGERRNDVTDVLPPSDDAGSFLDPQ